MKLSLRALELCRRKIEGDNFVELSVPESLISSINEDDLVDDFNEMSENEFIGDYEDGVHVAELGQHVLNMMTKPDVFVLIRNNYTGKCNRTYVKDAFYLSATENNEDKTEDGNCVLSIDYVPTLELIMGGFSGILKKADSCNNEAEKDIEIICRAFKGDKVTIADLSIAANYDGDDIAYEIINNVSDEKEKYTSDITDLVNHLGQWMISQIAKTYEGGVK